MGAEDEEEVTVAGKAGVVGEVSTGLALWGNVELESLLAEPGPGQDAGTLLGNVHTGSLETAPDPATGTDVGVGTGIAAGTDGDVSNGFPLLGNAGAESLAG